MPRAIFSATSRKFDGIFRLSDDPLFNDHGMSVMLHKAASKGDEKSVRLLLDYGTDVDIRDGYLRSALHLAASNDHLPVVELLLARGANRHLRDIRNLTPAGEAVYSGAWRAFLQLDPQGGCLFDADINGGANFQYILDMPQVIAKLLEADRMSIGTSGKSQFAQAWVSTMPVRRWSGGGVPLFMKLFSV